MVNPFFCLWICNKNRITQSVTFVTSFFHLACFQDSCYSMFINTSLFINSSYSWTVFHCIYTPNFLCPFIIWPFWIISTLSVLNNGTMNICVFTNVQNFFKIWKMFQIFWAFHLGIRLLGQMVMLGLFCWENARLFPQWLNHFTLLSTCLRVPLSLYPWQH
jgi:hypothetical protein